VRIASIQLGIISTHTTINNEDWHRANVFYTYIAHEGKSYKLMIDRGNCANIITKTALEKMDLRAELHSHPYNVTWVDKTAQFITQCCQVHIHMSSYKDHVWCDVLDIDVAHILLGRSWLYDLDVTSLNRYNTYEFKFNKKNSVEICQTQVNCREYQGENSQQKEWQDTLLLSD